MLSVNQCSAEVELCFAADACLLNMKEETVFWLNGQYLNINSLELFEYVRSFPELVPFELIRGLSFTVDLPVGRSAISLLAGSWCLWTATLKLELLKLMMAAFENHEGIIVFLAEENETSVKAELKRFDLKMNELRLIMENLDGSPPLSVWATTKDEVEISAQQFKCNTESWFGKVMDLPHIKYDLKYNEDDCGWFKSKVRHWEASFNKYKKAKLKATNAEPSFKTKAPRRMNQEAE